MNEVKPATAEADRLKSLSYGYSGVTGKPRKRTKVYHPEYRKQGEELIAARYGAPIEATNTTRYLRHNELLDSEEINYNKVTARTIDEAERRTASYAKDPIFSSLMHIDHHSRHGHFMTRLRDIMSVDYYDASKTDRVIDTLNSRLSVKSSDSWLEQKLQEHLDRYYSSYAKQVKDILRRYVGEYRKKQKTPDHRLTFRNVIEHIIHLDNHLFKLIGPLVNIYSLGKTEKLRDAAKAALQRIMKQSVDFATHPEMYDMLRRFYDSPEGKALENFDFDNTMKAIEVAKQAKLKTKAEIQESIKGAYEQIEKQRYAGSLLKYYETSGSTLNTNDREKLKKLTHEILSLEFQYRENVNKSKFELVFKPNRDKPDDLTIEDLKGFPEESRRYATRKADELRKELTKKYDQSTVDRKIPPGSLVINLDDGLYYPFMHSTHDSQLTKEL